MQKGQALIFLLIGMLVIVALGGAFYLGRSTISKPSPVPVATSQTTLSPTPTQDASREPNSSTETANWKTYTNTKLNFSVKYPETWVFKESPEGSDFAPSENLLSISQSEIFSPIFIFVKSVDNFDLSTQTLDQYQEKAITVGGISTKRISGITKQGGQATRRFTGVKMKNNGKTYGIITVGDSYIDIFDQILSTFKFTP